MTGLGRDSFFNMYGTLPFRRTTFNSKNWPFNKENDICHPVHMARAWFRCSGHRTVQCVVCQKELEGWEASDEPFLEHEKHAPHCPVVIAHRFLATLSDDDIAEISDTAQLISKWTDHLQESQLPSDAATPEQPVTVVKKKLTALKASKIKTNLKPAASASCLLSLKSPETANRRPTRQCTQVKSTLKKCPASASKLTETMRKGTLSKKPVPVSVIIEELEAIERGVSDYRIRAGALLNRLKMNGVERS